MITQLQFNNKSLIREYKSKSQIVRILSEDWVEKNVYCPYCLNKNLRKFENNHKSGDFICEDCGNIFELKSSKNKFSKKVIDGEYFTMINSIESNNTPNFYLLNYDEDFFVKNLIIIPKLFVSKSIIEKRKPLSENAKRAGWIGCNILLDNVPFDGKIKLIDDERVINPKKIKKQIRKFSFLQKYPSDLRGWTLDVWKCLENLSKEEFSLKEIYGYEIALKKLHKNNNYVKPKIRQQLQILRDFNLIKFLGKGKYRILDFH